MKKYSIENFVVYEGLPKEWVIDEKIQTAPKGFVGVSNGKSLLSGKFEWGIVRDNRRNKKAENLPKLPSAREVKKN